MRETKKANRTTTEWQQRIVRRALIFITCEILSKQISSNPDAYSLRGLLRIPLMVEILWKLHLLFPLFRLRVFVTNSFFVLQTEIAFNSTAEAWLAHKAGTMIHRNLKILRFRKGNREAQGWWRMSSVKFFSLREEAIPSRTIKTRRLPLRPRNE